SRSQTPSTVRIRARKRTSRCFMSERRLIGRSELKAMGITASDSSLKRNEKLGLFPARVKVTPRLTAWFADEVETHLAKIAAARKHVVIEDFEDKKFERMAPGVYMEVLPSTEAKS